MAFKVGTGVTSPAFGTGTVMESGNDRATVRFDKDDAEKTLLNQYLQPSQHETKFRERVIPVIELTLTDLFQLERLRLKRRDDCWVSFSANEMRKIWPYKTRGLTKEEEREYLLGECPAAKRIARIYLSERRGGGRVLVKSYGAEYRTNVPEATRWQREDILFVQFKLPKNWETEGPVSFRPPPPAIYAP